MTGPIRAVLFDIGSTLWSSPPEEPGALNACYGRGREILLSELSEAPSIEELIKVVEGHFADWEEVWRKDASLVQQAPTTDFVSVALAQLEIRPSSETLAGFTDAILETSIYTAIAEKPEAGMGEALSQLEASGRILGCVSNAFMAAEPLMRILAEKGLAQHLRFTVSSCELGIRKPEPAIYQAALDLLDVSANETVFVGDRLEADVEGPARLGMRTVLSHQYRQEDLAGAKVAPDGLIQHLSELPALIEDISSR